MSEVADTEFKEFLTDLKSLCPVTKNKTGESVSITDGNLREIIHVIYAVRNNLFHGGKDPTVILSRDYKLLEDSLAILLALLTRHLQKEGFLQSYRAFALREIIGGYDILA